MEAAEQEQSQQEPRGVLHMDRPQLEHADTFYKRLWKHQRHNQSSHLSTSRMPLDGARQTKAAPTQTRRLSMTEPHRSLGQHQSDSSRRYAMCRAEPHPAEETTDTAGHNPHHGSHMRYDDGRSGHQVQTHAQQHGTKNHVSQSGQPTLRMEETTSTGCKKVDPTVCKADRTCSPTFDTLNTYAFEATNARQLGEESDLGLLFESQDQEPPSPGTMHSGVMPPGVAEHHHNSTGIQPSVAEEARSLQMGTSIPPQNTDRLHGWKFRSQLASDNRKQDIETRENSAQPGPRPNSYPGQDERKPLAPYPSPVTPEMFKHLGEEGRRWYRNQCRKAFQVRINMIAAMVPCTKEVAKTALHGTGLQGMGDNMDWAFVKARHIQGKMMTDTKTLTIQSDMCSPSSKSQKNNGKSAQNSHEQHPECKDGTAKTTTDSVDELGTKPMISSLEIGPTQGKREEKKRHIGDTGKATYKATTCWDTYKETGIQVTPKDRGKQEADVDRMQKENGGFVNNTKEYMLRGDIWLAPASIHGHKHCSKCEQTHYLDDWCEQVKEVHSEAPADLKAALLAHPKRKIRVLTQYKQRKQGTVNDAPTFNNNARALVNKNAEKPAAAEAKVHEEERKRKEYHFSETEVETLLGEKESIKKRLRELQIDEKIARLKAEKQWYLNAKEDQAQTMMLMGVAREITQKQSETRRYTTSAAAWGTELDKRQTYNPQYNTSADAWGTKLESMKESLLVELEIICCRDEDGRQQTVFLDSGSEITLTQESNVQKTWERSLLIEETKIGGIAEGHITSSQAVRIPLKWKKGKETSHITAAVIPDGTLPEGIDVLIGLRDQKQLNISIQPAQGRAQMHSQDPTQTYFLHTQPLSTLQKKLRKKPVQHSAITEDQVEECLWQEALEWEYDAEGGIFRTDLQGDITFLEDYQTKSDQMPDPQIINSLVIYTSLGEPGQEKAVKSSLTEMSERDRKVDTSSDTIPTSKKDHKSNSDSGKNQPTIAEAMATTGTDGPVGANSDHEESQGTAATDPDIEEMQDNIKEMPAQEPSQAVGMSSDPARMEATRAEDRKKEVEPSSTQMQKRNRQVEESSAVLPVAKKGCPGDPETEEAAGEASVPGPPGFEVGTRVQVKNLSGPLRYSKGFGTIVEWREYSSQWAVKLDPEGPVPFYEHSDEEEEEECIISVSTENVQVLGERPDSVEAPGR